MEYFVQKASMEELEVIMQIYARARDFMAENGNPDQWGKTYPEEIMIRRDIAREKLYMVKDAAGIHGAFYFAIENDPTYAIITDGAWSSGKPYGVIHRIAGDGSGGILKAAMAFAGEKSNYLRIDTHENNHVMQNALRKLGFRKCGIIFVEDGTPRIGYDREIMN